VKVILLTTDIWITRRILTDYLNNRILSLLSEFRFIGNCARSSWPKFLKPVAFNFSNPLASNSCSLHSLALNYWLNNANYIFDLFLPCKIKPRLLWPWATSECWNFGSQLSGLLPIGLRNTFRGSPLKLSEFGVFWTTLMHMCLDHPVLYKMWVRGLISLVMNTGNTQPIHTIHYPPTHITTKLSKTPYSILPFNV